MLRNIDSTFHTWIHVHYAYSFKLRMQKKTSNGKKEDDGGAKKKLSNFMNSHTLLLHDYAVFF